MFANSFFKAIYDMRKSIFWWTVVYVPLTLWMVVLYPSFESIYPADLFESMPPSMKVLIGEAGSLSTLEGFLTLELFSFFYPVLVLAALLAFAGGLIGQEEDIGTLDLVLAQPIPRWRFLVEKILALVAFALINLLAIFLGMWLGVLISDQELALGKAALTTLDMGMLALLFAALTLMLTGLGLGRGASVGVGGGIAALTYLLNGLAPMADFPAFVQKLTPWYYYGGGSTLTQGQDWGHLLLLMAVSVVFLIIAVLGFERRDVGV